MKIKAIAAICRKTKTANIYKDRAGNQYIGNHEALYLVNDLPELDETSLLTIFDVPGKDREDWDVTCQELPEALDFADNTREEQLLQPWDLKVEITGGMKMLPVTSSQGLVFFDWEYLKPLQDARGYIMLTERYTPSCKLLVAVKVGLLLRALIWPERIGEDFVKDLEKMAKLAKIAAENEIV